MYSSIAVSGMRRRFPIFTLRISPVAILLKKFERPSPVHAMASGTDSNRLGISSPSVGLCCDPIIESGIAVVHVTPTQIINYVIPPQELARIG